MIVDRDRGKSVSGCWEKRDIQKIRGFRENPESHENLGKRDMWEIRPHIQSHITGHSESCKIISKSYKNIQNHIISYQTVIVDLQGLRKYPICCLESRTSCLESMTSCLLKVHVRETLYKDNHEHGVQSKATTGLAYSSGHALEPAMHTLSIGTSHIYIYISLTIRVKLCPKSARQNL